MSQPIVLLLLRIPVKILNVLTAVVGGLFYAPSYLMFLLIQNLIFGPWVKQSLFNYVSTWPIRFILILISFSFFIAQFVIPIIYALKQIEQTNRTVLALSFSVSIPATIYLMRRGYLNALRVLNVPQLKSPIEYITELVGLVADIPSILLTLINTILVRKIPSTLQFKYDPIERRYLAHIAKLVSKAFFLNIMLSFQVFLSVFSWRKNNSIWLKQQIEPNLHRLSLLIVLSASTFVDILCFSLFGWLALLSPNLSGLRFIRLLKYGSVENYRSYAYKGAILTVLELLCYLSVIPVYLLVFNHRVATKHLKKYRQCVTYANSLKFGQIDWKIIEDQTWYTNQILLIGRLYLVLGITLLRVLLFMFRVIVFLTVYKQKRMNLWKQARDEKEEMKRENREKQVNAKEDREKMQGKSIRKRERRHEGWEEVQAYQKIDFEAQFMYPCLTLQFLIDIPFLIMAFCTAILKPWFFTYYLRVFNEDYTVKIPLICIRFFRAIGFYLAACLLIVLLPLYVHRLRWLKQLWTNIELSDEEKHNKLNVIFVRLLSKIADDLFLLPLFYCMVASGTFLFRKQRVDDFKELPHIFDDYTHQIKCLWYRVRIGNSQRFQKIYQLDKAFIKDMHDQMIFWSTAVATRRIQNLCWILSWLPRITVFRKEYFLNNLKRIQAQQYNQRYSAISKQYYRAKQILSFLLLCNLTILVQIVIGVIVVLVLVPLTSWRLPTLIAIYRDDGWYNNVTSHVAYTRADQKFVILVVYVLRQMFRDIPWIPLHVFTLLTCPIRYIRYCYKQAYNYREFSRQLTFSQNIRKSRQHFLNCVFVRSFKSFVSFVEFIGVIITLVRIVYLYHLLKKAKHNFIEFFKQLIGLQYIESYSEYCQKTHKMDKRPAHEQRQVININMCVHVAFRQAVKDIPFAILSVAMLVLFPWRIFYLWNILKDQHKRVPVILRHGKINVEGKRREIVLLLLNIITTDIVCIIFNLLLILTGYKIPKVIQLFKKNFWLNLKKGVVSYDYRRDLLMQLIEVCINGIVLIKLLLITIMIVRAAPTWKAIYRLYIKRKQLKRIEAYNRFVREQTRKAGHQERLTYIGFMAFRTICSYLEPDDLDHLQRTNKDVYIWTNDEEIWQQQWETKYKKLSNNPNELKSFKLLVARSYEAQKKPKQRQLTYLDIVNEQIVKSIIEPVRISDFVSQQRLMYPSWNEGGLGPLAPSDQIEILFYYLFARPRTFIINNIFVPFFRNPNRRLLKQFIFLGFIITYIISWLLVIWFNKYQIFSIGKFIALKIMMILSIIGFHLILMINISQLGQHQVPSFYPFDALYVLATVTIDWVSYYARKAGQFVVKTLTPFYKFVSKVLIAIGQGIKAIYQLLLALIKNIVKGIFKILTTFKNVVLGIGQGYLQLLAGVMNTLLKFGRLGDLIFTPIALVYLGLPIIVSYLCYWKAVAIIPSSILTVILYIRGYSVLSRSYRR